MSYKSQAEYEHALAQMREDKKGEWHVDGYTIRKSKPYNLLEICRDDGGPIPKALRGQWTELELAKAAIRAIAGVSDVAPQRASDDEGVVY